MYLRFVGCEQGKGILRQAPSHHVGGIFKRFMSNWLFELHHETSGGKNIMENNNKLLTYEHKKLVMVV